MTQCKSKAIYLIARAWNGCKAEGSHYLPQNCSGSDQKTTHKVSLPEIATKLVKKPLIETSLETHRNHTVSTDHVVLFQFFVWICTCAHMFTWVCIVFKSLGIFTCVRQYLYVLTYECRWERPVLVVFLSHHPLYFLKQSLVEPRTPQFSQTGWPVNSRILHSTTPPSISLSVQDLNSNPRASTLLPELTIQPLNSFLIFVITKILPAFGNQG